MKESWIFKKIFEDLGREFATAENMFNRIFITTGESETSVKRNVPYYYGYQIIVGPDGKPHISEFGNVKLSKKALVESDIRQPLIDATFSEKDSTYVVTAEMPGVTKEDIKVKISEKTLVISAERADKKYYSEFPLDLELNANSAKVRYINGILEIKIKTKEQPKPNSTNVKVE
ncbi:MAG: archaeal heat shock protein Hsp20 [Nitrososphaerales archaeon]